MLDSGRSRQRGREGRQNQLTTTEQVEYDVAQAQDPVLQVASDEPLPPPRLLAVESPVGNALVEVADVDPARPALQADERVQVLHAGPVKPVVHCCPQPFAPDEPARASLKRGLAAGAEIGLPQADCSQINPARPGGQEHADPAEVVP